MKTLLVLVVVGCAVLAGCSSSSSAVTPTLDAQGHYVIHQTTGNLFSPANAKVPVGATVTWVNDGSTPHDVQARDGSFSSGPAGGMEKDDHFEHTFNQTGTFSYFCHVHDGQGMHATITVG
jgi:plastocyanin